ncbi:hypothetical protein TXIAM_10309 [Tenacibaculum xiamenense]
MNFIQNYGFNKELVVKNIITNKKTTTSENQPELMLVNRDIRQKNALRKTLKTTNQQVKKSKSISIFVKKYLFFVKILQRNTTHSDYITVNHNFT